MTIYDPYADMYYSYDIASNSSMLIPCSDGNGQGGGVTEEEMNAAINDAMSKIKLKQIGEDQFVLDVDGSESGPIEDAYLINVSRDDSDENDKKVVFTMSDNKPPISISLDELDDPNIDCMTF